MKLTKYIAIGAFALVGLTGCSDDGFFGSKTPSAIETDVLFSDPYYADCFMAAVYEQFGEDKSFRNRLACGYQGLNTDVEVGTKNSGKADYNIYKITETSGDLSNANGKDPWGYLNNAIEKCNVIIEGISASGEPTDETLRYVLGEAYFLRSFCYLEMVKLWGDVPARFASLDREPEGINIKKSDRTNVLAHLRDDLKKAAEFLHWSSECPGTAKNFVGRPSKAAALALLMRSDMIYAGKGVRPATWQSGPEWLVDAAKRTELYDEVLWAAKQILDEGAEMNKFEAKYEDIFKKICADETNYYNTEVLWAIPFADGARGQVLQYNCPKMSDAIGGLKNNVSGSSNSAVSIVPTLYYDFAEGDVRRDVTMQPSIWVYDNGTKFNSDASKVMQTFPEIAAELTADKKYKFLYQKQQGIADWYGAKYRVEWMKHNRTGNDDGVDYSVIRLTDVLLMAAEATLGDIQKDGSAKPSNLQGLDGKGLVNKVRGRAGVAPITDLTPQAIMDERKFEFTGEYIRKYDLMRWGILKDALVDARKRLVAMDEHSGEYAGLQDTIYFKYKRCDDYCASAEIKGFVIDSVYGLKKGETGVPAYYSSANGWVKTCIYESSSTGRVLAEKNYVFYDYDNEDCLLGKQYWPIFSSNVGTSNGTLWNDYMYK